MTEFLLIFQSFSAASMGLPQLLQDSDIEAEYPLSIDDEYVEERGYLPTLPGETSKISSALALFSAARILSKVLQNLYPANTSKDLSLNTMTVLENELDEWLGQLPQNLRLTFVQDKPSTDVTGNRSALLVSFTKAVLFFKILTIIVTCILPHSRADTPSCCWVDSWR